MAGKMRDPHDTRDRSIKQMKDAYEQNNRTTCPPEKLKEIERKVTKEILPRVYEK